MRDVFIKEIESGDLDEYVKQFLVGGEVRCEKSTDADGVVVYNLTIDNLPERLTFTPDP
jgi:hypothetical protein